MDEGLVSLWNNVSVVNLKIWLSYLSLNLRLYFEILYWFVERILSRIYITRFPTKNLFFRMGFKPLILSVALQSILCTCCGTRCTLTLVVLYPTQPMAVFYPTLTLVTSFPITFSDMRKPLWRATFCGLEEGKSFLRYNASF